MSLHAEALPGFWSDAVKTLTLHSGFNTTVVVLGTSLLGLAAGVVGVFTLLRKRALMADALSHSSLPGIALAFLTASALGIDARSLSVLLIGAACTGVLGVLSIQWLMRSTRLREDASIGVVLSVFFGVGIVLLSYIQKNVPQGAAGLSHFIYGQTAAMSVHDAGMMAGIALLSMVAALLLLKEFTMVCFNDAFAAVDGWSVTLIDLLMMALVVLVTVAGLQAVGLILVVAMLIIPPVSARFWTDRVGVLVPLSGAFGAFSGYLGSSASAVLPQAPAGAVIVLTSGGLFAVSAMVAPRRGVIAAAHRHLKLRLRIAGEHLLETAYEHGLKDDAALDPGLLAELARRRRWPRWLTPMVEGSLRRQGLIEGSGNRIRVRAAGLARGARVHRNHKLWEQYLISHADLAPNHVDWSVDQVEHVLDDGLINELIGELRARGISIPELASDGARA